MLIYFSLFILYSSFIKAQTPTREQLTGTWIGVHYAWDDDFFVPIGSYVCFDPDSTCTIGAVSEQEPPVRSRWSVKDGAVRLDTSQFGKGSVCVEGDLLHIEGYFPLTFRRFRSVALAQPAEARQRLTNRIWVSDTQRLHLHTNGQACREDRSPNSAAAGDRTIHRWSLATYENTLFLIVKGVQGDSVGNYQPLLQLTEVGPDAFRAIGWNGKAVDTLTFRATATLPPGQPCEPVGFQPCVTYLYRPLNMYYSYDQKGHRERLYFVRQTIGKSYKPVSIAGQSGLIRVRFEVNCRGEAGRFDFLELDDDYQKRLFDRRLSEPIRAIFRQSLTTGWLSGKRNREGYANDYVQFVTLRLRDGLITEIFP